MIDRATLREALSNGLGFLIDSDEHLDEATDALLLELGRVPATLPRETVQTACDSAYGAGEFRREYLPAEDDNAECVKLTISPEDDVEWFAYLTADQWAAVTA